MPDLWTALAAASPVRPAGGKSCWLSPEWDGPLTLKGENNPVKYMIASDIHGSAYYCRQLMDALLREGDCRLLLLGDLLYHGPRNDLPRDYAPKEVIGMLSGIGDRIFCVRGNCDTEVDQMVLPFPILADYCLVEARRLIFATHGHHYNLNSPPLLKEGEILLHGHTHVPACQRAAEGFVYLNPGSVSIPKEDSPHSYMTLEGDLFLWKELASGSVYQRYDLSQP